MRTQPRHIRMSPYNRAEEAHQHRIDIQADLSPLEASLEADRRMAVPNAVMYSQGYYRYDTQQ